MHIIIVGAGPAGAATAYLLARSGVEVTLLEREESFDRVFRGEGLMPSGVDALLQLGLGEVLATIPSRIVESWHIWIDREEAFVVPEPVHELGVRAMRVISQVAFLEALVAVAGQYPRFHFQPGARVRELLRDEMGRVVGVRAERSDKLSELRADLVIGCDGRGSVVRTLAGLHLHLLPEQYDVLWFKLPAPDRLRDRCQLYLLVTAHRHPTICYTSWDGRLQYGLVLPKGMARAIRSGDWLAEVIGSAPTWLAEHLLAQRNAIEGPLTLNVLVGRCPKWSVPGLLLLGDAAHPMSPVRAQGINLALRDAIIAVNHLVPVLRSGARPESTDAAARAVQAEREPEIVRAQTLQRREAAGQGDARSSTWRFTFAKRVAPVLGRYHWAQRLWLTRQHDLRFGSTEVKLRIPK